MNQLNINVLHTSNSLKNVKKAEIKVTEEEGCKKITNTVKQTIQKQQKKQINTLLAMKEKNLEAIYQISTNKNLSI